MPNDNTLGAPTEGLGQTVTFAANGGSGVPQMQPARRGSLKLEARGGGAVRTAQALQIPPPAPDATIQILTKLGSDILRPRVEAERTARYMEGMQKAAQGEAITEIVDEQPWYSKVFGSTSLVDGARAYTASAKATAVAVDMEENMPDLRKLSAQEFAKYSTDKLLGSRTGDPATDAMLTQQIASTLPSVMKGQAKAHLRYQQEVFEDQQGNNMTSAFALLGANDAQARNPDTVKEEVDMMPAHLKVIDALTPPAEMDPKRFYKMAADRAARAIANGNFAVSQHLERSGQIDKFSAEEQATIRRARSIATAEARVKLPFEFREKFADWATLSSDPATSHEQIKEGAAKLDKEYRLLTGDTTPIAGGVTTTQELMQLRNSQRQEMLHNSRLAATAKTKEDKALAEQALIMQAAQAISIDGQGTYIGDLKPAQQQAAFDYIRATNPAALPTVLARVNLHNKLDEHTQNSIEGNAGEALRLGDPLLFHKAYRNYAALVKAAGDNSQVIADRYAGVQREVLARYHNVAKGNPGADAADIGAMYSSATRPVPKQTGSDKDHKKIVSELSTGVFMRGFNNIFAADKYPIEDPDGLATILGPKLNRSLETEDAIKAARLRSDELDVVAGYHWVRGSRDTKLEPWLLKQIGASASKPAIGSYEIHRATRHTIELVAKTAGIDGKLTVNQTFDAADGVPRLYIEGMGDDGQPKIRTFTAKEIQDNWAAKKQADAKPADLTFGPKVTFPPESNAPSIYASQAEWAKYREQQATK